MENWLARFGLFALLPVCIVWSDGSERPNIVLVMADDLGFSDLGCYGSEIETPNLDRLARRGLRFRQFYNTAKCDPSRISLLSGCYYPEARFTGPSKNVVTIAETLKGGGYATLMSGKWHIEGEPWNLGFDRYFGHLSGWTNFFVGDDTFRFDGERFEVPQKGFYTTDAFTDYAIRFLEESVGDGQPFFLYLAYNAPHYPLQAKKGDVLKYLDTYEEGWNVIRSRRYEKMKRLGVIGRNAKLSPRPESVPAWESLNEEQRKEHALTMATFAGMVDCLDQNLGRLIKRLKEMGKWENTVFLFLSDNGACPFQRTEERTRREFLMPWDSESYWTYDEGWAHVGNTPFRLYKQNQHEGGIASPFIVHWPKGLGAKERMVDAPGHIIDIAATLYDIADTSYPDDYDGKSILSMRGESLLPLLRGEPSSERRVFWQRFAGNKALRAGDWKVVAARYSEEWELFNIRKDRSELNDLSAEMSDRVRSLADDYKKLTAEIEDQPEVEDASEAH